MSAHINCIRGNGGRFITRAQEIMNDVRKQAERESYYEGKTAELSVTIAMSGTVFDADGLWHEIVEPEDTWEAAYKKLEKKAVEQGILKECAADGCLHGGVWNMRTRAWDACPTCRGVGYVAAKAAEVCHG